MLLPRDVLYPERAQCLVALRLLLIGRLRVSRLAEVHVRALQV